MRPKTIIISEAGVNHNGSVEFARQLIKAAADAGADFVKFQTFKADKLVSKIAKKADYQKRNSVEHDDSQYGMLKSLELTEEMHKELIASCKEENIQFLSTGFDAESIDYLDQIGLPFFKIPSGEITNKPFLQHIASKMKPVIMSTGMATLDEIGEALDVLIISGLKRNQITILHCNTEYPTPMKDVNLKAMLTIRESFGVEIGYSDHTLGIEVPIAAVALGATVIEKHFTLDRNMPGPDHRASLQPNELKDMVRAIRNIELALSGNGKKEPSNSERPNIVVARKSIHIRFDLSAGTILKPMHLVMKRPGDGISPMRIDNIIGKTIISDLMADHKLSMNDLI